MNIDITKPIITLIDFNTNDLHLKYHVEVKPILDNGGVILYKDENTITVASCIFSEICNLLIDPYINNWWMDLRSIDNPTLYASDVCDPVCNNIVKIIVGVGVKNSVAVGLCDFVLPAWKNSNSEKNPVNYLETLTVPFSFAQNGFITKFTKTQGVTQIFGDNIQNWFQNFKRDNYRYNVRHSFKNI